MTSRTFAGKTGRQTNSGAAPKDSSAGENAVALAPPAYGIDFVDLDMKANARTLLRGKSVPVQGQGVPEEEGLLQGKFATVQRQGPEEEELLQGRFANAAAIGEGGWTAQRAAAGQGMAVHEPLRRQEKTNYGQEELGRSGPHAQAAE